VDFKNSLICIVLCTLSEHKETVEKACICQDFQARLVASVQKCYFHPAMSKVQNNGQILLITNKSSNKHRSKCVLCQVRAILLPLFFTDVQHEKGTEASPLTL